MATLMRNLIGSQPLLKNNFIVTFLNPGLDIPSWLVQETTMPKFKQNEIEVAYFNTSQWMAGRYLWDQIELSFISPIGPSSVQKLVEFLRTQTESLTGRVGYLQSYKTSVRLEVTDPLGVPIQAWIAYNCQIVSLDHDPMSYDDDKYVKLKLVLRPDYCENLY